jgi:plasmid stability protein
MGSILVRGLGQKTIERLKERARLNGRTLQQEVKVLLERAAEMLPCRRHDGCRSGGGTGSASGRSRTVRD